MSVTPNLPAQAPSGGSLNETALYSLDARRHAATIAFANLAVTRAADSGVRKAVENLVRAHGDARQKLERIATERHLTLAPPEHDTSTALLEQARSSLDAKVGRAFDSPWVHLADNWLSTLLLDNNPAVTPPI